MCVREIRKLLFASGLNVSTRGQDLIVCPASGLSQLIRKQFKENKVAILRYMSEQPAQQNNPLITFDWDGRTVDAQKFDASVPTNLGGVVGFDCETEYIQGNLKIPRLALVAVSDGNHDSLVHPDDLPGFIESHHDRQFVFHNAAFDYWVVHKHLENAGCQRELRTWTELAERRRFHDTMQLDRLIRIAHGESAECIKPRDLAKVADCYAKLLLSKDDPFRKRYGELIGKQWVGIEDGFFKYAIKDPIATVASYIEMHKQGIDLMKRAGFSEEVSGQFLIMPDAVANFGPLTETIQTNAGIAFAQISRNGLATDRKKVRRLLVETQREIKKNIKWIDDNHPGIFKRDKNGEFEVSPKRGQPCVHNEVLRSQFLESFNDVYARLGSSPSRPVAPQSLKQNEWAPYLDKIKFANRWFGYKKLWKQKDVLTDFDVPRIHAKYDILKVTGRTGCSSPNMQNVPRENRFRELIVPSAGYFLLIVDYNFIELVTLAATLRCRFGASELADVIEKGIDPHSYTASMLLHSTYENFLQLKKTDANKYELWRQRSKPVNFGVPAGMGPTSIVDSAKLKFKTSLEFDEAEKLSNQLTQQIYPEIGEYLIDKSMVTLATNLNVSVESAWRQLDFRGDRPGWLPKAVRRVVAGNTVKSNGELYNSRFPRGIWDGLNQINQNPNLAPALAARMGSELLAEQLFFERAATISGRVRGGVRYTTARNTPFQGLAADGAKIALANLVLKGYRAVGFIHDETLLELRDEGGYVSKDVVMGAINQIKASMEQVTLGIPVSCEAALATCWSKSARWIEDGDRILPWSPEMDRRSV